MIGEFDRPVMVQKDRFEEQQNSQQRKMEKKARLKVARRLKEVNQLFLKRVAD